MRPGDYWQFQRATVPADDVDFYLDSVKLTDTGVEVGIKQVEDQKDVVINGNLLQFDGYANVTVYNVAGSIVADKTNVSGSFDISGLSGGVYIITVKTKNGKTSTFKVIK